MSKKMEYKGKDGAMFFKKTGKRMIKKRRSKTTPRKARRVAKK